VLKPAASVSFKASAVFLIYLYTINHPLIIQQQIGIFLIFSLINLGLLRVLINATLRYYRKRGFNSQTVLIVGKGKRAREFADKLLENSKWGFKILGFIDCVEKQTEDSDRSLWSYREVPEIGDIAGLPEIIKTQQVDWAVFAVENDQMAEVEQGVIRCQEMGARVVVLANLFPAIYSKMKVEEFLNYPILFFDTAPQKQAKLVIKEVFDRLAAAVAIVLVSPIMILSDIFLRFFSKGSILYIQERLGRNGKKFRMYKFRTMAPDADKLKPELEKYNEMDGPVFKLENDPRVTRIGRILRKTSIDELPQLFNVLMGDMSMVGPRPPLPKEVKQYDHWQRRRLSIKPGITCLWQVGGRNNINFENWMKLDMEYIDNWSLWLDTKILARTLPAVISRKGAK